MPPRLKLVFWLSLFALLAFLAWTEMVVKIAGPAPTNYVAAYTAKPPGFTPGKPRAAKPVGNPGDWLSSPDYPTGALVQDKEGVVRFTLSVDPFGDVADCKITKSSGLKQFDERACAALKTRARFYPALDETGQPVAGTFSSSVRWQIAR